MKKIGILLTNTGTPDNPDTASVRRYLKEFLSDKRIVHLPRLVWLPILYGLILPFRAKKSAALYQKIWTKKGAPMRHFMQQFALALENNSTDYAVRIGMNYGNPSILEGIKALHNAHVERIVILPLFPQFSDTTTSSTYDRVEEAFSSLKLTLPRINIIDYADHPEYIKALAKSVRAHWEKTKKQNHLLISFHGIPERFIKAGDFYALRCEKTAKLLANALQLADDDWTLCYQSQFGYDRWLTPSTQELFVTLPQRGIKNIDIICPGFSMDCLETLEEINIRGREIFMEAQGNSFHLIACLNDSDLHLTVLKHLLTQTI